MRVENKREELLEIVFTILLCLSLVCFAGIPALEQGSQESNVTPISNLD